MRFSLKMFFSFLAIALIAVLATALLLAGLTFSDRQQRAFDILLAQARDLARIVGGREKNLVDVSVLNEQLSFFGGDSPMRVWLVSAEGLVYDAVNPRKDGTAIGALTLEQTGRYITALPSEGMIVREGFERFFTTPYATAVVPLETGVLMLHRPMAELEQGDLMVIWRQAALSALAGAAAALVLVYLNAMRLGKPVSRLAEQSGMLKEGSLYKLDPSGTKELSEIGEALESAVLRSREAEELRRSFLQNVSHELRSPLTSIQGYLQALLDGAVPEEERSQYLGIALDEALRLGRVIGDIRALSRVEYDAEAMDMQSFDINEVIRRSLAAFSGRMEEGNIRSSLDFRIDPCAAFGNADLIRQVVDNLIGNAIKYAGAGGRITIRTNRTSERVFVSVADDGPGIPKEDIPFLFERFYKVDKAHSGGGSGLGLAIAKSILDRHGQVIHISSQEGRGTIVSFTLDPRRR